MDKTREPRINTCDGCGLPFLPKHASEKYCSLLCKPTDRPPYSNADQRDRLLVQIIDGDGPLCGICRQELPIDRRAIEIDHILPRRLGGDHRRENLRATHIGCNRRRKHYE